MNISFEIIGNVKTWNFPRFYFRSGSTTPRSILSASKLRASLKSYNTYMGRPASGNPRFHNGNQGGKLKYCFGLSFKETTRKQTLKQNHI